jgi:hypothetical protein
MQNFLTGKAAELYSGAERFKFLAGTPPIVNGDFCAFLPIIQVDAKKKKGIMLLE